MNTTPPPPLPPKPLKPADRWSVLPIEGPVTAASVVENLLKFPGRVLHECGTRTAGMSARLIFISLLGLGVFGGLLGMFSGAEQYWAAPAKVVAGTVFAMLICLPSLYIFSALAGVDAKLSYVASVLASALALAAVLLLGFTPVIWVFSQSTESLPFMGFLALAFWLVALIFGLRLPVATATTSSASGPGYLRLWATIFVIVTLQMTTALRPIIGREATLLPTQKRFFLEHWVTELNQEVRKGKDVSSRD